jgi:hypothetical protein
MDFKKLSCKRENLRTFSAVFQDLNDPDVARVFIQVNERMRDVLKKLDEDDSYRDYRPPILIGPAPPNPR